MPGYFFLIYLWCSDKASQGLQELMSLQLHEAVSDQGLHALVTMSLLSPPGNLQTIENVWGERNISYTVQPPPGTLICDVLLKEILKKEKQVTMNSK